MPTTNSLELSRQYTSFSGVDINVVIEGEVAGTLQAISYGIQREKGPIYVMGHADPRSFSRGKRGIAGTMVNLLFDHHFLYEEPFISKQFIADKNELYPDPTNRNNAETAEDLNVIGEVDFSSNNMTDNFVAHEAWYLDQLPPFDAVILAVNEYGNAASMRIYGIEALNEGGGFSVDDMSLESQMTYVALSIAPWKRLGKFNFNGSGFDEA